MIRIGKTYGNLMVDIHVGSDKARDRARRIVATVTGGTQDEATSWLKKAKWNVKAALVMKQTGVTYVQALRRIKASDDSVRTALGKDLDESLQDASRSSS
jgi:N-acetylmuramic acid 6-phosphate etherase